jgi:cytochrome c oxidase subunit 5b
MECGSAYKMHYVGPADDGHGHHAGKPDILALPCSNADYLSENPHPKPKNMADFLKPEYLNL